MLQVQRQYQEANLCADQLTSRGGHYQIEEDPCNLILFITFLLLF